MKERERIKIALPSGELEQDVIRFMQAIGLDLNLVPRRYLVEVENMPIDFVIIRASSIPAFVKDSRSKLKAGITGSDIIWESGMEKGTGEEVPISTLIPNAKRSSLYIGMTKAFADSIRSNKRKEPQIPDLSETMIATKYPRIATDTLREYCPGLPTIYAVAGADEALQFVFPDYCVGIVGIIASGMTREANGVEVLKKFYDVTIQMIETGEKLTLQDISILNDLRNRIAVAIQRRRDI